MARLQPKVFISHTTTDQRDYSLAHQLAKGLEKRGVKVWIAPTSIPSGATWKEELVSAVLDQCNYFLVILSAASVQAKWVLEEIKLARKRIAVDPGFTLLPLQVGKLEDYKNIGFVEQYHLVQYHNDFHQQLEAVAAAMKLLPPVPSQLQTLIAEKTSGFVGRQYVFDAAAAFLRNNSNGYFTIAGDPGVGKSAILAKIVQQEDCIAHFNIRSQGINSSKQFLENVCSQLITRYALPYTTLPPEATQNSSFLAKILEEASQNLSKKGRIVIAVDALDEAIINSQDNNILFLPATLPDKVYFIVTRRHTPIPFSVHTPQEVFDLMQYQHEGIADTAEFIRIQTTTRPALLQWITENQVETGSFIAQLSQLSGGNFMYIRYILPDIEKGVYNDLSIQQLPRGLEGYYEDHWRRMGMMVKPIPRVKIRIVYVLSEARLPVSRQLITRIASDNTLALDELNVQEVLDEWSEFLHEQQKDKQTLYSVYHASFRDFLHQQDIVQAAGVTLKEINTVIADNLWSDLFG